MRRMGILLAILAMVTAACVCRVGGVGRFVVGVDPG
jgi:hypothetical protein